MDWMGCSLEDRVLGQHEQSSPRPAPAPFNSQHDVYNPSA